MDYEKAYKDALERARELKNKLEKNCSLATSTGIESIFPELAESEDERIRKKMIDYLNREITISNFGGDIATFGKWIAWLEKQDPNKFEEELEKAYKCADEVQYKRGYEDAKYELEKQCDNVLRGAAINLITWIDYNAAEGNMYLSNIECKDIEDALVSGDWDKIYAYIKKKLEKQSKQNFTDSYCQDNCKGFQETGKCFADGECKAKRDAEHNPAWSEEDEGELYLTISLLDKLKEEAYTNDCENCINWLKSLKPQPRWKPTEEQMQSLYSVVITYSKKDDYKLTYDSLNSLYDDLKKL